jgi:hypothetical protein
LEIDQSYISSGMLFLLACESHGDSCAETDARPEAPALAEAVYHVDWEAVRRGHQLQNDQVQKKPIERSADLKST